MAERLFVDTGYLVALINRRDGLHAQAVALAQSWQEGERALLTTDGVLIEFGNFFSKSPLRALCLTSIRRIRRDRGWHVEPLNEDLIKRGEARYGAHPDKSWSLTDCLSMEVMLDHSCEEAATPDHHFVQAGFRISMQSKP